MPEQLPYYISILRLFSFAFNFCTDDVSFAQAAKAYSILGIIKTDFIFMDEASYIVSSRNSWFVWFTIYLNETAKCLVNI